MALEMKQSQQMRQELKMTPQLQQAIKLLQLSRHELVELVQQEMVENPLLEETAEGSEAPTEDERTRQDAQEQQEQERQREREREREPAADAQEGEVSAEKVVEDIDWERYLENYTSPLPAGGGGGGYGEDLPGPEQTLSKTENLTDHLLWQLGVAETSGLERALAEVIIGNLDEVGYLRDTSVEEIAEQEGESEEDVEESLLLVQEFDPAGVGARDLAECLLIQARRSYPGDLLLRQVISEHLSDLERKNYSGIARSVGASKREVMDAHRRIMTLDPKPGRQFVDQETTYITPDIYIVKQGEAWVPVLNEDGLPRLRVSEYYRRALRSTDEQGARTYVQERLRSAWWLIRSIHQRQKTILRVTESIIRFQHGFFERGIDYLKPLVLREVADDIGMHESTISRVTTNKYVHTPRGIFELKFFFNSSIRKSHGDDVAAEAVKQRIKKIIGHEDRARPFSDQKLVEILSNEFNIEIARRTVAKYREMLGILSSSKRKQLL